MKCADYCGLPGACEQCVFGVMEYGECVACTGGNFVPRGIPVCLCEDDDAYWEGKESGILPHPVTIRDFI